MSDDEEEEGLDLDVLGEEKREEFEEWLEQEEEEVKTELLEKYRNRIQNQIQDDRDEIRDFNIVISGFQGKDIHYDFIRTEPMFHEKEKNFDVLLSSDKKEIDVLVECERTLISDKSRSIEEFRNQAELIEECSSSKVDIEEYFRDILGYYSEDKDYVVASKMLSSSDLEKESEEKGFSFIAWNLVNRGSECNVSYHPIRKSKKAPFDGHSDPDMEEYLKEEFVDGVRFSSHIDFTYSSSNYYKITKMLIAIQSWQRRKDEESFDYELWKRIFKIELSNYKEEEKETLYQNFIEYGKDYNLIKTEEERDSVLESRYDVNTRASKDQEKLKTEIHDKIAEFGMQEEFETEIEQRKEEKFTEMKQQKATGGTTLSDFAEEDGS